jgi:hypothetical protein
LYAATADAAATAEAVAREVLAQQGLAADIRLDRWDPASQAWLPGDAAATEVPSGQQRDSGHRRLRAAGGVVMGILDGLSKADF